MALPSPDEQYACQGSFHCLDRKWCGRGRFDPFVEAAVIAVELLEVRAVTALARIEHAENQARTILPAPADPARDLDVLSR
ncbi:hypothetical protein D3C78_1781380 [compost metagenome]